MMTVTVATVEGRNSTTHVEKKTIVVFVVLLLLTTIAVVVVVVAIDVDAVFRCVVLVSFIRSVGRLEELEMEPTTLNRQSEKKERWMDGRRRSKNQMMLPMEGGSLSSHQLVGQVSWWRMWNGG
mmetsp:Transcript_15390/g.38203  ORF Transcript_15390/g.38203 Transcript_15390/m.38203 type:complete len:124 (+) Transcript_15390:87-458(+)